VNRRRNCVSLNKQQENKYTGDLAELSKIHEALNGFLA
jgi:hypothetical protein